MVTVVLQTLRYNDHTGEKNGISFCMNQKNYGFFPFKKGFFPEVIIVTFASV